MIKKIAEFTFTLILVFLVLSRARGFASAIKAIAAGYVDSVVALQGRGR